MEEHTRRRPHVSIRYCKEVDKLVRFKMETRTYQSRDSANNRDSSQDSLDNVRRQGCTGTLEEGITIVVCHKLSD